MNGVDLVLQVVGMKEAMLRSDATGGDTFLGDETNHATTTVSPPFLFARGYPPRPRLQRQHP